MEKTPAELGSGVTCRALIITQNGAEMNDFWNSTLRGMGVEATYCNFSGWQKAFAEISPHLLLLDGTTNLHGAFDICRASSSAHPCIPLVAVLTRSDVSEHGAAWHAGGAQNFLRLDATRAEIETVLEGELKIARLENELAGLKQQLINARQYDNITQFLTRRHFFFDAHRECSRARRYGRPLSCLMININYYDDYSREFGLTCTNYLLRSLAIVLRQLTRESDIIARFAPNKIVALLPETDIHGAVMVRERILEEIVNYGFEWETKPLPTSISIGEAERPHIFDSSLPDIEEATSISVREEIAQLLEDADNALAVAQRSAQRPAMFIEYDQMPAAS